jgi:hypothetical protein
MITISRHSRSGGLVVMAELMTERFWHRMNCKLVSGLRPKNKNKKAITRLL